MGVNLTRSKALRRVGPATLLIVVALALSGCWANGDTTYFDSELVVTKASTADIIGRCSSLPVPQWAGCALDVIRVFCHTSPVPNFGVDECDFATDHRYIPDMSASIQEILAGGPVCFYYDDPHFVGIDAWYSMRLGDQAAGGAKCE
jgi:hypothetical protein